MNQYKQIYLHRDKKDKLKFEFFTLNVDTRTKKPFYKNVLFTVVMGEYNVENKVNILRDSLVSFHNQLVKAVRDMYGMATLVDNVHAKNKLLTINIDIEGSKVVIVGKYQAKYNNRTALLFQTTTHISNIRHLIGGIERIINTVK